MPGFLRTALDSFRAEVPPDWAYTLTTEREGRLITERFDPSKPPAEQWALLRTGGQAPTRADLENYFKYKAGQAPGAMPATFNKGDIDPGSLALEHEDAERAEFTGRFREQSANADKMLGHVRLRLTVRKRPSYIEKFTMELREPYSPVLTVRMRELAVTMEFAPPGADRPSLPVTSSSHFLGSVFFMPVEENLRFSYADFTRVP
jgi:hypothetical protein